MENENAGENQETNQEQEEQEESTEEVDVDALKKENETLKAQKAHWKKKAEAKAVSTNEPEVAKAKTQSKSNEPDYAQEAFLEGRDIKHPEDKKMVQDEAQRLKMPLNDILAFDHIKSKLKDAKDQREAEDGMPKGRGKSGGSKRDSVDYHLAKGTTPDDLELANKVIDARIKSEQQANKFSEDLFVG